MEFKERLGSGRVERWFRRIALHRAAPHSRYIFGVLVLIMCWPSVRWYVARVGDGSDEPWGVLALLAAIAFSVLGFRSCIHPSRYLLAAGFLLLPLLLSGLLTPLIKALFVVLALAALLVDRRSWVGNTGLFVLALPLISSLQFYGGFPLRWVIGQLSSRLLGLVGFSVEAEGTVMHWRGEMIVIDAPCSGVQMLWSSAFLACIIICIQRLDFRKSLLMLQVASVSAFAGNVLRNCLLFFVESGVWNLGGWAHDGIGLVVFGGVLGVILVVGMRLKGAAALRETVVWENARGAAVPPVVLAASLVFVSISRVETVRGLPGGDVIRGDVMSQVRGDLINSGWEPLRLDERSAQYAEGFPGTIELFGNADRQLVVRVIDRATRRYHLSADCYRSIGYTTEPMPILQTMDGSMWGRVIATRGEERVEVRERVESLDGQSWTDPSSWFWSAALGKSAGPWVGYSESVPVLND